MKTVLISGADRNIGLEMTKNFLGRGWKVYAGRFREDLLWLDELKKDYPESLVIVPMDVSDDESVKAAVRMVAEQEEYLDMLVHNAAHFGGAVDDYDGYMIPFNINCLGAIRLVQAVLPLMQKGMQRLCFVSSEAGSVSLAHRDEPSSYCMSKTALNMALRLMFNKLQPLGYTFRLFHPGWSLSDLSGSSGAATDNNSIKEKGPGQFWPWESAAAAVEQFIADRDLEDRMVLIDVEGAEWPF